MTHCFFTGKIQFLTQESVLTILQIVAKKQTEKPCPRSNIFSKLCYSFSHIKIAHYSIRTNNTYFCLSDDILKELLNNHLHNSSVR